jgi:hypothetical protein
LPVQSKIILQKFGSFGGIGGLWRATLNYEIRGQKTYNHSNGKIYHIQNRKPFFSKDSFVALLKFENDFVFEVSLKKKI